MRSESHLWTSTPYTLTSGLFSARLSVDFSSRARGGQRAADSLELGVQERREPNFGALNRLSNPEMIFHVGPQSSLTSLLI